MPTVSFNTHFPGYDVLGEINRSNARVLKARHIATGDLVAIKHFALNTDADTLRRFERESQIMTQMTHPNIVRVREVRLDAELPYIVMDYVEGGSARQLITELGCLPVELTIRLGLQVLNAFRLIHAEGIVHRDVKPENILYHRLASGELHFLLTDFGVARLHEQPVTMTGQSLMTYEYAAPEQFDNPRNVGEAADYYALGVVLYECLTGSVPFAMRGETGLVTFMNAVLTTPPPVPVLTSAQPLPDSLTDLLRHLLAKSPAERIHNPDGVKLALKQAEVEQLHREQAQLSPTPLPTTTRTEIYRPTVPDVTPRPAAARSDNQSGSQSVRNAPVATSARRKTGPVLAIAALVLLTGAGAYWFFGRDSRPSAATPSTDTTTQTTQTSGSAASRPDEETQQETARQRSELARQRYQQQVAEASRTLDAQAFGGKKGLLGGVKGLSVRLRNPSPVAFKSVAVKVEYIKENGQSFKSTVMYFNRVGPDATITRRAPDSQRGTQFSARVLRADAERPDSIAVAPSLNP